ncbi:MAG: LacI family DNA-binding transcriptional regulator, partial [bacterium]
MSVSQKYLAEHLGISTATVSRALNNDPAIKPKTRARVMSTAAELGYFPPRSQNESKTSTRITDTIGVLVRYDGA